MRHSGVGAVLVAAAAGLLKGQQASAEPVTFITAVQAGRDDAEESENVFFSAGFDVEVGINNPARGNLEMGIRFQDIQVPPGAAILSAVMQVTPRATSSADIPLTEIVGNDVDDAIEFNVVDALLLDRVRFRAETANSVNWNIPQFLAGVPVQTPELGSIIQEIVNRDGWVEGNSIALIVRNRDGSNNANRRALSFEGAGNVNARPILQIIFDTEVAAGADVDQEADDAENDVLLIGGVVGAALLVVVVGFFAVGRSRSRKTATRHTSVVAPPVGVANPYGGYPNNAGVGMPYGAGAPGPASAGIPYANAGYGGGAYDGVNPNAGFRSPYDGFNSSVGVGMMMPGEDDVPPPVPPRDKATRGKTLIPKFSPRLPTLPPRPAQSPYQRFSSFFQR